MKKIILYFSIILSGAVIIASCKKDYIYNSPYTIADSALSYLKVIDVDPFFANTLGRNDTFNILVNGVKVNGNYLNYNSLFPFSVNPSVPTITTTYIAVNPGANVITLSYPGAGTGDAIVSLNENMLAGQKYSLLITDSIKSNRDSSKIFVQDIYTAPVPGYINLRFINTVLNDTASKTVDLYSYARNGTLLTKVKPGDISTFNLIGYNIQTLDTFYVTRSLPSTLPASTPLSSRLILAKLVFNNTSGTAGNAGAAPQRTYTLYYKGDANLKTGAKARSLGIYIHD